MHYAKLTSRPANKSDGLGPLPQIVHLPQSTILWGAAGYLMRSHYFDLPYSGHPLRAVGLEQTLFRSSRTDVTRGLEQWLRDQRNAVFETVVPGSHSTLGLILPPLIVETIEASASEADLVPTAMQIREDYADLREWLRTYQDAVDNDDTGGMLRHKALIRSVEDNVRRRTKSAKDGGTSLSVSLAWLGVSLPSVAPIEMVKNRFGVRASLNRLIFSKRGAQSLQKLLGFFDERSSPLGRRVMRELPNLL